MAIISAAVKRTILTLNVEHQLVSPVDLNLVVEMEHWLWIILAALFFGKTETTTCLDSFLKIDGNWSSEQKSLNS